jgi:hypothetical protein
MKPTTWVLLGANALIVIGSLMPRASLGIFSADGISGEGVITLLAGLVAIGAVLIYALTSWQPTFARVVTWLAVTVSLAVSIYDTIHIAREHIQFLGTSISPDIGTGLWLRLIASIAATVTLVVEMVQSQAPITAS